ncbi:Ion channel [Desulfoluna spongiiphila]|uniref:Ion channel n=1 Tax=Desulfoluna spongiiphila TaxID=419481 RepID=A0A1G5AET8_9BACT|nr:Ion channel [Desulfoluna spongiiphila]VVS90659.1 potassium channel domain [Desulfoluna spongiiphila]
MHSHWRQRVFQRTNLQIGQLLLVLTVIVLVAPSLPDDSSVAGMALVCLMLASLATALGPLVNGKPRLKLFLQIIAGMTIVTVFVADKARWSDESSCMVLGCVMLYHFGMMAVLLYHLFRHVTQTEKLLTAINFYLLTGITFSYVYVMANYLIPGAFDLPGHNLTNWSDYLYFSFVTLTSVGYGDISPQHHVTQSLAVFEAIIGVLSPTIMIARFVGGDHRHE